jgi:hypothetical protein
VLSEGTEGILLFFPDALSLLVHIEGPALNGHKLGDEGIRIDAGHKTRKTQS